MTEETGYLIERRSLDHEGRIVWLAIGPDPFRTYFTPDASAATRFCLERDAVTFIRVYENSNPDLIVTAHGWMETLSDDDASRADRVMQVFARYQREMQKAGGQRAPSDTLIIAASLTAAHFAEGRLVLAKTVAELPE